MRDDVYPILRVFAV